MTTIVSSGFLDAVWDVISSRVAIGIYVILMLIAVIVLIVSVILDEQRRVDPLRLLRDGSIKKAAPGGSGNAEGADEGTEGTSRLYMLTETDERMRSYMPPEKANITLKELCERFRNYAAAEKKLYYTPEDIRKFIAGMAVSTLPSLPLSLPDRTTTLSFFLIFILSYPLRWFRAPETESS